MVPHESAADRMPQKSDRRSAGTKRAAITCNEGTAAALEMAAMMLTDSEAEEAAAASKSSEGHEGCWGRGRWGSARGTPRMWQLLPQSQTSSVETLASLPP